MEKGQCSTNVSTKAFKKDHTRKLIFDLDNTLLYLSADWHKAFNQFIAKGNYGITVEELYHAINVMEIKYSGRYVTKTSLVNHFNDELSTKFDQETCEEFLDQYAKIPLMNIDIVDDVLTYLSSRYTLIVYSNWFTDNQILRLRLNRIDQYFSEVFGWDVLPTKPSRKGLNEIVGDDNINNYTFIGDNLDSDIRLPDSIGMDTIFLNLENITQDKYKDIKNIGELKMIL